MYQKLLKVCSHLIVICPKKMRVYFSIFYWNFLSCVFWLTSSNCSINSFNFSRCESKIIASASFVEKSKSNKTNNNFSTLSLIQIPVVSAWESPFNCNIPRTVFVCIYNLLITTFFHPEAVHYFSAYSKVRLSLHS